MDNNLKIKSNQFIYPVNVTKLSLSHFYNICIDIFVFNVEMDDELYDFCIYAEGDYLFESDSGKTYAPDMNLIEPYTKLHKDFVSNEEVEKFMLARNELKFSKEFNEYGWVMILEGNTQETIKYQFSENDLLKIVQDLLDGKYDSDLRKMIEKYNDSL